MKKTLLTCSIFFACMAFVSCGNNDNEYSSDGEMITTEYTTEKSRYTDKNDDYYEADRDGNVDARDSDGVGDSTGSNNSAGERIGDAVDGIGSAGESIIDGVGDAVGDIMSGAGDAAEDVAEGFDGEKTTD